MKVAVVAPWDSPDDQRRRVWAWCRSQLWAKLCTGDWSLIAARDPQPALPWSKGRAIRSGLAQAGRVDVIVVADADIVVPERAIRRMVADAAEEGWATPGDTVYRLNELTTAGLLLKALDDVTVGEVARECLERMRPPYPLVPGGGLVALNAHAWREVGGIDPRFEGWGGEDRALALALRTLIGDPVKREGPVWHLWHEPSPHMDPGMSIPGRNKRLLGRYRRARGDAATMRALVAEHQEAKRGVSELRG